MENVLKKLWRGVPYLLPLLALILAAGLVGGTLAAYTNQGYKKGVATTQGTEPLFSSNYLTQQSMPDKAEEYGTASVAGSPIEVQVRNSSRYDINEVNPNTIVYTMKFLAKSVGEGLEDNLDFKINENTMTYDETEKSYVLVMKEEKLVGGKELATNRYNITVPDKVLGHVVIIAEAIPNEGYTIAAGNRKLARILAPVTGNATETKSFTWAGKLVDVENKISADKLAAFNYEVSGLGAGNATVTWDTSLVALDPFYTTQFVYDENPTLSEVADGKQSLTFAVDSSKNNYYLIQFYRVESIAETKNVDWKSIITFSGEASEPEIEP